MGTSLMHIDELWIHPVKSMIGQSVATIEISADRVVGDRGWAVRDEARGGIRGAKKIGALMRLSAEYQDALDGPIVITLPDGTKVTSADNDVDARLSAALDHPVSLWPLRPATDLDHYRRGAADSDDIMAELRAVFGRDEDEPLPDLAQFPPIIMEFESPPGTYLDAHPLLIMTTQALASLQAAVPDAAVDVRRFRPNIVIDAGSVDEKLDGAAAGHPEFGWVGRQLTIGSTVLDIVGPCPRCVMVTREISADLPADRSVLRHIVRDLDQNVGVYATVTAGGRVSTGDRVSLSTH